MRCGLGPGCSSGRVRLGSVKPSPSFTSEKCSEVGRLWATDEGLRVALVLAGRAQLNEGAADKTAKRLPPLLK